MKKQSTFQLPHLLLLLAIGAIVVNLLFPYSGFIHLEVVVGFAMIYISFSLLHHYLDKSLTVELTLEYILIAALVMVIVVSLLH